MEYLKTEEITIMQGHKDCNKEMKALVDILKSSAKDTEGPIIDFERNLWITKFNNTFVEMSLETVPRILDTLKKLSNGIRYYKLDLKEILEFRTLADAPKKDFTYVSVYKTENGCLGIVFEVQSKVSTNKFSIDLIFRECKGLNCGLPTQYTNMNYILNRIDNRDVYDIVHENYTGRYVIQDNELEDLNNGLIVIIKDEKWNSIVVRMMKNILYRPIKSDLCIVDYILDGDTGTCRITYNTCTGSNPPIKIEQIFMVYGYGYNKEDN